jgi:phenylacetate-CoA ligase
LIQKALRIVNPALEKASRKELLALQERRLIAQVHRAYERIPFYNRTWPKAAARLSSLEEFREIIPFQTKTDLLDTFDAPGNERISYPGSPACALHMTSGTTGLGQEVHPLTRLDMEAMGSTWVYQAIWAGLKVGDSVAYTFPVGMQTGGLSSFMLSERMASFGFQLAPYPTEKKIEYLLRFQPAGLIISPAFLTRFQAVLEQMGKDPRRDLPNLKAIFIAGEGYSIDWAERSIDFWGAHISEWYGLMQSGMNLCVTCEHGVLRDGQRGLLHTMEHRVLCEVLYPGTNQPVEPGEEGEMVITTLYREAFPVVRFRTGDKVRLASEPCNCGRPFACIEAGTTARYDDMMKIRGQNLWPDAVDKIIFGTGDVEEYSGTVRIDSSGREIVEVAIEFTPSANFTCKYRAERVLNLTRQIQRNLNIRMELREAEYLSLPRFDFKVRRWIDHRRDGRDFVRYVDS